GLAAWGGYRTGLVRGVFAWTGFTVGLALGVAFIDEVANFFPSTTPQTRFAIALAFLLLVVVVAQSAGVAIGSALSARMPRDGAVRSADRASGSVVGIAAVLVVLWLLIPALASTPGWASRGVRGSWIARQVEAVTPAPPSSVEALSRLVAQAPYPQV